MQTASTGNATWSHLYAKQLPSALLFVAGCLQADPVSQHNSAVILTCIETSSGKPVKLETFLGF